MRVLFCSEAPPAEQAVWLEALAAALPEACWVDLAGARAQPQGLRVAVVARPPERSLAGLPELRFVQSLWAGVDSLLADPTVPPQLVLARMVDPVMTAAMVETVVWAVIGAHRGFFAYARRQSQGLWQPHGQRRADEVPVLVLGQGELGTAASVRLRALGYPVIGWRRRDGQAALAASLPACRVLVNLLPLTPSTEGLLNAALFAALPHGASVINLARGAHVVDAELLAALDAGHLRHAVLDVFRTEPLPAGHPYWQHPKVTVLPHAAAQTDPRSAAAVAADNIRRWWRGEAPRFQVDRQQGY